MAEPLQAWLSRLETLHPTAIDLGLSRVSQVAQRLGLLPFPARVLTVAGTNGKGSVVGCAAALGRGLGWRTGAYTSPHLLRFNERIAIDGEALDDDSIVRALEAVETARESISLTYFEFTTLAALWLLRAAQVELAVLEVGLGGRLDAVNIVDADVCVITAIGLDHQAWLGDTVEAIAVEKAGVARVERPVVLAEPSYPDSLLPALHAFGAHTLRAGRDWHWARCEAEPTLRVQYKESALIVPVPAGLRPANVAAAVVALWQLSGEMPPADRATEQLQALRLPGRQQRLEVDGLSLLLDVAHNGDSARALADTLAALQVEGRVYGICGLLADKDPAAVIGPLLPRLHGLTLCALPSPRAVSPQHLREQLEPAASCALQTAPSVGEAWRALRPALQAEDLVLVFGSFFTVAGMLAELEQPMQPVSARYGPEPEVACSSSA